MCAVMDTAATMVLGEGQEAGTDLAGRCYVACGNGNGTKLGHDLVVSPLDGSVKEETG